ncbi:MAG: hypothetical protein AB7N73_06395 [Gemmatimonadales bacterium]|nr:hypothetical protein [Gemmatimonadota bacterium]MCA9768849.1 hypothetical protein [Gemmatimonadota bacterium]MCB9517618.1 hypothetical protein [Gemmatimonadales bacterium]HPF61603.1 hypothetical protein [Gemmatimonadales bacterium]HRX17724.1 hypothetical protein [Gemmatimonadales bacterium]
MRRQTTTIAVTALLATLAACGSEGGDAALTATTRDSAGVAIMEYPAEAWEQAPAWQLSASPMATVGGDPNDTELDLSSSGLGTLLSDNRLVAATTIQPAQIYLFAADGSSRTLIGRAGEGPGEYRIITGLTRLGGDTIAIYDLASRKGLLFSPEGDEVGRLQIPFTGDASKPPQLVGRTADGMWVFRAFDQLNLPADDAPEQFRNGQTISTWREGGETLDSLMSVAGPVSVRSTVDFGGQSIPIGRPLAYGANSTQAISGNTLWVTPGNEFTLRAYDQTGTRIRDVRIPMATRPVTEADREHFKQVQREGIERARSLGIMPPQILDSELQKIEQTPFAENHPAIGQLTTDNIGRLWATTGFPGVDSVLTYGVFSADGALLGRVTVPEGIVLGASEDRVVVRREDPETGLVRLEVWGLLRVCDECETP